MAIDEFGFPEPAKFEDAPRRHRPIITLGRLTVLCAVVGAFALLSAFMHLAPDSLDRLQQGLQQPGGPADLMGIRARHHFARGMQAHDQRRYDEAAKHFGKLIEIMPNYSMGYVLRGDSLARLKRYDEAIQDYDAALKLEPDRALLLNNRAYFRALKQTELDEALQDVERAIEIEGPEASFVDTRAYLLYLKGRHEESLAEFDKLLEHPDSSGSNPEDGIGEIFFHRGLVHRKLGQEDLAERDFRAAREHGFEIEQYPEPVAK